MTKFKVGDKVKFEDANAEGIGFIVNVDIDSGFPYTVETNKEDCWRGYNFLSSDLRRNFLERELTLIKENTESSYNPNITRFESVFFELEFGCALHISRQSDVLLIDILDNEDNEDEEFSGLSKNDVGTLIDILQEFKNKM